jgi:hypothetical protein
MSFSEGGVGITQEEFDDVDDETSAFVESSLPRIGDKCGFCVVVTTKEEFDDIDDDASVFAESSFCKVGAISDVHGA